MGTKQLRSRGFTLVASLLLLVLLSGIALGLMYMVNTETRVGGSDLENSLAFHASEGGMEKMTADLANLFSSQQAPTPANIAALQAQPPNLPGITYPDYTINFVTQPNGSFYTETRTISAGPNKDLMAQIVPMTLSVTAKRPLGDQVHMYRTVEVALIPVFQFGVFSDSDLSYFPGPVFDFAGRVHTNGNLFLADGNTLQMHSKVSAVGEVIRAELANGHPTSTGYTGNVFIPRAPSGCDVPAPPSPVPANCRNLATNEGSKVGGPTSANNPNWTTISTGGAYYNSFIINGRTGAVPLTLPFVGGGASPIQIIRRPAPNELPGSAVGGSRLYNQAQIRIMISDDPRENHPDGSAVDAQDIELASLVPATITSLRPGFAASAGSAQGGVAVSGVSGLSYFGEAKDTTGSASLTTDPDFLPPRNVYGVQTPPIPFPGGTEWPLIGGYLRVEINRADGTWIPVTTEWLGLGFSRGITPPSKTVANSVHPRAILIFQELADRNNDGVLSGATECLPNPPTTMCHTGNNSQYVWYPINFYDPREGEARDTNDGVCRSIGIMNAVELDVNNLKNWLAGTYGGNGALVDSAKQNGYVLYFSDRRGMLPDANVIPTTKTGEAGLEDVINSSSSAGTPDGVLELAEDVDGSGQLDRWGFANIGDGFGPVVTTPNPYATGIACQTTARKNKVSGARHVLRLVNGSRGNLPRKSDGKGGFTVASENPVYILGDYNAAAADNAFVDDQHAAAAVIADAVTLLSNNWSDRIDWINPTDPSKRPGTGTWYRVAIAGGKNINFPKPTWATANDLGTDGGVHNFLRYIEAWGSPLNYRGSLVSLYYSQYATGVFKCCTTVYSPPDRRYSFDTLFLDPQQLPPGTPMFRDVANTSYRQDFTPAP